MKRNGTEKRVIVYLEYVGAKERNVSAYEILKALTWQHRNVEVAQRYNYKVGTEFKGIELGSNKEIFKVECYKILGLRITLPQITADRLGLTNHNIYHPVLCSAVA